MRTKYLSSKRTALELLAAGYRIGVRRNERGGRMCHSSTLYSLNLDAAVPHRRIRSSIVRDLEEAGKLQLVGAYDGCERVFKIAAPAASPAVEFGCTNCGTGTPMPPYDLCGACIDSWAHASQGG